MEAAEEDASATTRVATLGRGGAWQVLWFVMHLAAVYAIAQFLAAWLAGWTRTTVLPLLQHPVSSGHFEFLFSHVLAFSFIPAFTTGLLNARFKHKVAEFVWLIPAVVLAYKFITFPGSAVVQSRFVGAFHYYFGGGFLIPEFRNWREFWSIVGSNPDMTRGMAQMDFTAPFYAGIGYSLAAWIGRRTEISRRVREKVKNFEESRFGHQA